MYSVACYLKENKEERVCLSASHWITFVKGRRLIRLPPPKEFSSNFKSLSQPKPDWNSYPLISVKHSSGMS